MRIFLTGQLAYGLQPQARKRSLIGTQAAFEAIAATMAFGSVNYDAAINAKDERLVWPEPRVIDRLRHLRGPGESYSDVIIRQAALEPVALVPNDSCPRPSTRFVQSRSNSGDDIGRGGGEWGSPAIMGSVSAAYPVDRSARRHPRRRTSPTTPCMSCESWSRISYRRLLVNRA